MNTLIKLKFRNHVRRVFQRIQLNARLSLIITVLVICTMDSRADVPQGSPQNATNYYKALSQKLNFSTSDQIFQTRLDDVATYFGYDGFAYRDLQDDSPTLLMSPGLLLNAAKSTNASSLFENPERIVSLLESNPFTVGDILATRFFAPKIMNISLPEAI